MPREYTDFGPFRINHANASLTRNGTAISLTPKAFALLSYLVRRRGQLATRDAIFADVWRGAIVSDAALTVCICEIRNALGDNPRAPRYIATAQKRGYRFIAQTSSGADDDSAGESAAPTVDGDVDADRWVVGRDEVLEELQGCLERAMDGTRQMVLVTGEPGIGKTTIIETFLRRNLRAVPAWVAKGQCLEHCGVGEAYLPILDALGDLARQQGRELVDILLAQAPSWLQHLPAAGAGEEGMPKPVRNDIRPGRMLREMTGALEAIADSRLLVLVLEDLHWCDLSSMDLLSFVARHNGPARLLIVASYRPADAAQRNHPLQKISDELQMKGRCRSVPLQFLEPQHVASYLEAAFPGHDFKADFCAAVHQKCEGNPLFMVNLLNSLRSRQLIRQVCGRWRLAESFAAQDICFPDDIERMIDQRVEELDGVDREILEAASIASEPGGSATDFTVTEVATVLSVDEAQVETSLARLGRYKHFLQSLGMSEWPDGTYSDRYEFMHGLYQNVLYARLGATRRVQAHRKLGLRLEAGYGPRCAEIASKLALHFEIGGDYHRAVQHLTRLAETATARGANREALQALEKALQLLDRLPQTGQRDRLHIAILLLLAPVITASQGNATPAIEECYLRARQLCERAGDQNGLFRALFGLRSFYVIRGDLDKAHELAQSLLELAGAVGDPDFLLEARVGLANSEYFAGDHQASREQALKGIALYDPTAHANHALLYGLDPGVFCHARAGQTAWFLGYPDQALHCVQQAVELAERVQHPYSLVLAILNRTQILLHHGNRQAALDSAQRSKTLAVEHEFSFLHAWALYSSAWALALNGETDAALAEIKQARAVERPASAVADSYLAVFLAETYLLLGDADNGLACLTAPAREHAYDAVRSYLVAEFTALREDVSGHGRRAETLFHDAIGLSRTLGVRTSELRAASGLARLLIRRGDHGEAHRYLAPIMEWFEEGFETADMQAARRLMATLEHRLDGKSRVAKVVYLQTGNH